MKWIKAIERLPNVHDGIYIVKDKDNEVYQMGYVSSSPTKWHYLNGKYLTESVILHKDYIVEWLDESESIPSVTNEEDELWWEVQESVYDGVLNTGKHSPEAWVQFIKQHFTISRKPSSSSLHS